jgi:hypothetical protein
MENFEVEMTSNGSKTSAIRLRRSKIADIGFWITKNGWIEPPNSSSTEMALVALKASLKLNNEKNASTEKTSCRNRFRMLIKLQEWPSFHIQWLHTFPMQLPNWYGP